MGRGPWAIGSRAWVEIAFWVDRVPHPRIEGTRAEPYFEVEGEPFFDGWP